MNFFFLATHRHSGAKPLVDCLDLNPRVQMYWTSASYKHPDILTRFSTQAHKNRTSAALHGDVVEVNASISHPAFYRFCKFVYLIRSPRQSLNLIASSKEDASRASRYYTFRLRRLAEMARRTPGAVFLTWDDLLAGRGLDLIEKYLCLKEPLAFSVPVPETVEERCPYDVMKAAEDSYERHLYFIRQLPLSKVS